MMNSDNAPKEIVQSFIDLVNMAKWLMDENQQPSLTQELRRLFPSIRSGGRKGGIGELVKGGVGAGESSASATDTNDTSFERRTIEEIWESKARSKKTTEVYVTKSYLKEKLPVNLLFFLMIKPSEFRFVT